MSFAIEVKRGKGKKKGGRSNGSSFTKAMEDEARDQEDLRFAMGDLRIEVQGGWRTCDLRFAIWE